MLTMPLFRARLNVAYLLNGWTYRLFNTRQIQAVRPDVIVANSSYAARHYADLAPSVVPGGIDLQTFFPSDTAEARRSDLFRVGTYPGRGRECKRLDDTLAACRLLAERGVPVELHVFDREAVPVSESFALVHHGAHGALTRPDVAAFMHRLDLFISAEDDAGWSNPAAEAMACGVPLVCTEAGTTDFAIHEQTALVVPARDPTAIADAAERLWRDPGLAQRLRDAGLVAIREFDWLTVARRLIELFRTARKDEVGRAAANERARRNLVELGVA
jgi:glycosyltransferase involved in cell wall biosynthesis